MANAIFDLPASASTRFFLAWLFGDVGASAVGGFLPLGFLRFLLIEPLSGQGDARVRFLLPSPVWTDECLMIDYMNLCLFD